MPKINVYLPDDLATAVRDAGIPVSAVCQRALADAVAATDGSLPRASAESDRLQSRLTARLEKVLELAGRGATSVQLTEALIDQGNNLALAVLSSLDVEPADLRAELTATASSGPAAGQDEVLQRAADAAIALGHNYVGCEHLLLALTAGAETDPATKTLHTLGLTPEACHGAVRAALGGIGYAQSNLSLSGLSAPIRSVLEEIRQRLGRLESDKS